MFKQSLARCAHDTWPNDDSTSDNSPRNGVLLVDDLQTEKWLDLKTDDQCRIDSSHRSMFCQRHVFLKNGPLFRLCSFFSNNFLQSQRDSNSDRRSRRRARWPLDHHHSPRHVFLKGTSPASFYLLLSFQQVTVNLFPMVGFEPWTTLPTESQAKNILCMKWLWTVDWTMVVMVNVVALYFDYGQMSVCENVFAKSFWPNLLKSAYGLIHTR